MVFSIKNGRTAWTTLLKCCIQFWSSSFRKYTEDMKGYLDHVKTDSHSQEKIKRLACGVGGGGELAYYQYTDNCHHIKS